MRAFYAVRGFMLLGMAGWAWYTYHTCHAHHLVVLLSAVLMIIVAVQDFITSWNRKGNA